MSVDVRAAATLVDEIPQHGFQGFRPKIRSGCTPVHRPERFHRQANVGQLAGGGPIGLAIVLLRVLPVPRHDLDYRDAARVYLEAPAVAHPFVKQLVVLLPALLGIVRAKIVALATQFHEGTIAVRGFLPSVLGSLSSAHGAAQFGKRIR